MSAIRRFSVMVSFLSFSVPLCVSLSFPDSKGYGWDGTERGCCSFASSPCCVAGIVVVVVELKQSTLWKIKHPRNLKGRIGTLQ